MNSQNVHTMQQLLKDLVVAEVEVAKAQTLLHTLRLKNGQETIACRIGGLILDLTVLGRDYMPKKAQGRQALLDLLEREAHDHLIACRSKHEGIQFQIRKLAKATGAQS